MKKTVKEVIELVAKGKNVKIKTPAGMQPISGYALKGSLDTLNVQTETRNIVVTPSHRFFTTDFGEDFVNPKDANSPKGSWICAGELTAGSTILNDKLSPEVVKSTTKNGETDIYDLHVDHPTHSFYGNGLVNHNTGKTLLALHALVETQKRNGVAVLIDAEFAFNPAWFRTLGGNPNDLIHYEPDYIDQVYDFTKRVVDTTRKRDKNIPITVVYDSVAASPSKKEFEGAEYDMGKRAQAHGKGLRMLMGLCKRQYITFIAINQLRHTFNLYGLDKDTTGGQQWKYAPSVRVRLKKGKKIEQKTEIGKKIVGIHGSLVVEKSRLGPPFATSDFDIYFKNGIDPSSGLFDVLVGDEVIKPRTNDEGKVVKGWWSYRDSNFRQAELPAILEKYPELLGGHSQIEVPDNIEVVEEGEEDTVADM